MENANVTVFWTAEDNLPYLLSELLQGRLRQGWGARGMQLAEDGVPLSFNTWAENYTVAAQKTWSVATDIDYCKARFSILSRMLTLRRGDLIIVPRMPRVGEFCIARVSDGYIFDESQFDRINDFGHVVRIDKNNLKSYRHTSSPETAALAAKFRHYRSAVSNIRDEKYAAMTRSLYSTSIADATTVVQTARK